jgi:hypothetical protein
MDILAIIEMNLKEDALRIKAVNEQFDKMFIVATPVSSAATPVVDTVMSDATSSAKRSRSPEPIQSSQVLPFAEPDSMDFQFVEEQHQQVIPSVGASNSIPVKSSGPGGAAATSSKNTRKIPISKKVGGSVMSEVALNAIKKEVVVALGASTLDNLNATQVVYTQVDDEL